MAITFAWKGHDGSDWNFTIGATNVLAFFGNGGYGSPIQVGQYNDAMHIRTSVGDDSDACAPPHLTNIKFISSSEASVNGGSTISLTSLAQANCIRITVNSDTSVAIIATRFYAYDSSNVDNPPPNITFKAVKLGSASWSTPHGRTNAVSLGDSLTPATSHQFYVAMSLTPTSTGASNLFTVRFEADIQ